MPPKRTAAVAMQPGAQNDASPAKKQRATAHPTGTRVASGNGSATRHLACDACRKRKVKCDSVKPACSGCQRHNTVCHYQTEIRKRGSRVDYVHQLEKRLQWMEQLLRSQSIYPAASHIAPSPPKQREQSGRAPDDATYRLRLPDIERPSKLVEAPPALRTHLVQLYFRFMAPHFSLLDRQAFMRQMATISPSSPSEDAALLYSVLAVAARFAQLPNVTASERQLAGRAYAGQSVLALNADEAASTSPTRLTLKTLQTLINLCIHASGGGTDNARPMAAQDAALLHTECTRMALRLKLHLIDEQLPAQLGTRPEDKTVLDLLAEKRRAWWCCFMLNQLSAMTNGQPAHIDEFSFQVAHLFAEAADANETDAPSSDAATMAAGGLPGQIYIPRLLVLMGRVLQFVNRPRQSTTSEREREVAGRLERELHDWHARRLPTLLQGCPGIPFTLDPTERDRQLASASTHIALLCLYHTGAMLLHRSLLTPHPTRDYCYRTETPLERQSLDAYRQSAISLFELAGSITDDALLYQHPLLAYSLWTAAMIWIHDCHATPAPTTTKRWHAFNCLHQVCRLLNKLRGIWEYAGHLEETLTSMLLPHSNLRGMHDDHDTLPQQQQQQQQHHSTAASRTDYPLNGRLPIKSYLDIAHATSATPSPLPVASTNPDGPVIAAVYATSPSSTTGKPFESMDKPTLSAGQAVDIDALTDFTSLAGQPHFSLDASPHALASTLSRLLGHVNGMSTTASSEAKFPPAASAQWTTKLPSMDANVADP